MSFLLNLELPTAPASHDDGSSSSASLNGRKKVLRGRGERERLRKSREAGKAAHVASMKKTVECHGQVPAEEAALETIARAATSQDILLQQQQRGSKKRTLTGGDARPSASRTSRTPLDNSRLAGQRRTRGLGSLLDDDDDDEDEDDANARLDAKIRARASSGGEDAAEAALLDVIAGETEGHAGSSKRARTESDKSIGDAKKRERFDVRKLEKKPALNFSKLKMFSGVQFLSDAQASTLDERARLQQEKLFGSTATDDMFRTDIESFEAMPIVSSRLAASLKQRLSVERPTFVQQRAVPQQFAGRDCLIRAETGSGKTLSYVIPLIERLHAASRLDKIERIHGTFGLVIAPTRELSLQIYEVFHEIAKDFSFLVPGYLVGGEKKKSEKARLRKGITLLVATPGRLLDHLQTTQAFVCNNLSVLVLDEADRLLDMGFEQDIQSIMDLLRQRSGAGGGADHRHPIRDSRPVERPFQTVLCSATLPTGIERLAGMSLHQPVAIDIVAEQRLLREQNVDAAREAVDNVTPDTLTQFYTVIPVKHKLEALAAFLRSQLVRSQGATKLIVFVASKDEVEFLYAVLGSTNIRTHDGDSEKEQALLLGCKLLKLHGSLTQTERTAVFHAFMGRAAEAEAAASDLKSAILLATDVAARGLDFPNVDWIVQYDPPLEPAEYVHRVGRTARIGRTGRALVFLQPHELGFLGFLSEQTGLPRDCLQLMKAADILATLSLLPERGHDEDAVLAEHLRTQAIEEQGRIRKRLAELADEKGEEHTAMVYAPDEAGTVADRLVGDLPASTTVLQWQIMRMIGDSPQLHSLATQAFASSIRAYATFPRELKDVFNVRRLHLGHLARSFALREKPSEIVSVSSSGQVRTRFVPRDEHGTLQDQPHTTGGTSEHSTTGKEREPKKQRRRGAINSLRSANSISRPDRSAHAVTARAGMMSEFESGF